MAVNNALLQDAIMYATDMGMKVLPCKPTGEQNKAPLISNGFKAASANAEQIRSWWQQWPTALIGVAIPDHYIVLDIDPRNGGSLEALEAVTGPLPDTLTSWSGRGDGGRHLWFHKPAQEISSRQLPKGVDLKAGGRGYVIVPPSLHPATGKPYVWTGTSVAELPVSAIDALAPRKPSVTLPAPAAEHSGNLNGLVRSVAEAVEGERNQKLYWASCRAFDHGNDDIIQDLFEAALSVGLTDSEATATIDSARRTDRQQPEPFVPRGEIPHTSPILETQNNRSDDIPTNWNSPESDNSQALGNPQNEDSHLNNLSRINSTSENNDKGDSSHNDAEPNHDPLGSAFTATSLLAQEFPPLEYVVPGVITEGLGLLVAPPKIGKSWMVLGVGIACSTGGRAFNAITVDQRPVLYLALEDGPRRLQDRLHTIGMTTGTDDLQFMTETKAGAMLTIGAFIERNAHRKPLVILDTLGKARDVYTGNDAYQKDYKELSDYKRLVDRHPGSSLLIVHHTNKGAHGDFVASVSGTQGITGAADSVLTIERGRGEDEAVLNVTSRDAAEGSYAMTFDNGKWTLDGADLQDAAQAVQVRKATTGVGDAMTEVIELVSKHPEGIKPKDVATLLHWEDDKARNYLRRAYESGRIQRLARGIYTPVPSVPSVPFTDELGEIGTQSTQGIPLQPGESENS